MTTNMRNLSVASGFTVHLIKSVRDETNNDLPLLDIIGPKQSVRATWAKLKSRTTYDWQLGGPSKLAKDPGHRLIKNELPNGWVNWTWVSRQAIPRFLNPSFPTYCWKEPYEPQKHFTPPATFVPTLTAAMPFPVLPEWGEYLWSQGNEHGVIEKLDDSVSVIGYKILPNLDRWSHIVKDGFTREQINVGIPLPSEPEPVIDEEDPAVVIKKLTGDKFPLGQIVMTPSIMAMIESGFNPAPYLARHADCDWGDLSAADAKENNYSLNRHLRILSSYNITDDDKIWILTEADRSVTTILLPEDY